MSQAITKNEHWQHRAAEYSTHGSRKGVSLLGWDKSTEEYLSYEQRRESLVKAWQYWGAEKKNTNNRQYAAECGIRMHELQAQLNDLKKERMSRADRLDQRLLEELKKHVSAEVLAECLRIARNGCD